MVPFVVEILIEIFSYFIPYKKAFLLSYGLYDLVGIFGLLCSVFIYIKTWFSKEQSFIGCLFIAATMIVPLKLYGFHPWTFLETILFTISLLLIYKKRFIRVGFIILLATLNRETALFIVLTYFVTNIDIKKFLKDKTTLFSKPLFRFLNYLSIWLFTYMGLRYFRGNAKHVITFQGIWDRNLSNLDLVFLHNALIFGFFWIFAFLGIKHAPSYVRRSTWILPFYLTAIIAFGVLFEVKLLMPLYPIIITLGLSFIFHDRKESKNS